MARYENDIRNAEIIRRRDRGQGPRTIAREMNLTPSLVAGVLWRAGMTSADSGRGRGNGATPEIKALAVAMGFRETWAAAGEAFGVDPVTVWGWGQGL